MMKSKMKKDYHKEAEIIKVLSHPVRLKIVSSLCAEQSNVKFIWKHFGLPQSTVSRHLAHLRDTGIISCKKIGNEVFCNVVNPSAKKLIELLD